MKVVIGNKIHSLILLKNKQCDISYSAQVNSQSIKMNGTILSAGLFSVVVVVVAVFF